LAGFGRSREFPQFSALGFPAYNILSFGHGEEVGWRGFALPRLQTRHSAFFATLLLTLGWALWHLPLFLYRPGYVTMGAADVVGWFLSFLTGAVLLTWLYNESKGSLLVVALFHAAVDIVFTSDISSQPVITTAGVLMTCWGFIVLVVTGPNYLSRHGKMIRIFQGAAVTGFVERNGSHNTASLLRGGVKATVLACVP
jgi:membrane protease YdiL (CAAX protease family)